MEQQPRSRKLRILCGYQVGNWTLSAPSSRSKSNIRAGAYRRDICLRDRTDRRKCLRTARVEEEAKRFRNQTRKREREERECTGRTKEEAERRSRREEKTEVEAEFTAHTVYGGGEQSGGWQ